MKALHRLAGNFPKRGYGLALRSEGFPVDTEVFPKEGSRMPGHTMAMPYGRKPVDATTLVDMFHVYEIQPLAYGKLASIHIANCCVKGVRPSGYVDAVFPDSMAEGDVASLTVGLEHMLRFNDFVASRTFWEVSEKENTIAATPWQEDAELDLTFQLPESFGEKEQRALVATAWRTATYRRFGPWAPGNRQKCLYEDDRLLWNIPRLDRSLYVCLGDETNDDEIIRKSKAFLYSAIYSKLPRQMSNIASMSAAVSMSTIPGFFSDSALCVVYPEANVNVGVDLRSGKCVQVSDEVHAMVAAVMKGDMDPLMADMLVRYAALTGLTAVDHCSFSADYDVYMSLYRLRNTENVQQLLREWYAVNTHLRLRHGLSAAQAEQVLVNVDTLVLRKLRAHLAEVEACLCQQGDSVQAKDALALREFLWSKAILSRDECWEHLSVIVPAVEKLDGQHFFPEIMVGCGVADAQQDAHAAFLLETILTKYALHAEISRECLESLGKATEFIKRNDALRSAMTRWLLAEYKTNVQRRPLMTPLSSRFLDSSAILLEELRMLRDEAPTTLPNAPRCRMVREYWNLTPDHQETEPVLVDFMTAAFRHHPDKTALLQQIANAIGADMTSSLCAIFSTCARDRVLITPQQLSALLGAEGQNGILSLCSDQQAVMDAWCAYVENTVEHGAQKDDLYPWLMAVLNVSGKAAGAKGGQQLARWSEKTSINATLRRSGTGRLLPTPEAFDAIRNMAQQGSEVFRQHEPQIQSMCENLLAGDQAEAARPYISGLLPCFHSTERYPRLRDLAVQDVKQRLMATWKQSGFWKGIEGVQSELRQMGLTERDVMDEQIRNAAGAVAAREMTKAVTPNDFRQRMERTAGRKTDFLPIWQQKLREAFVERYTTLFMACDSVHAVEVLRDTATRVNAQVEADRTNGGYCVRVLRACDHDLTAQIRNPSATSEIRKLLMAKCRVMSERTMLSMNCAPHVRQLLCTEYGVQKAEALAAAPWHVRLAAGMICGLDAAKNQMDWQQVLDILCPGHTAMFDKPYSVSSLPLLQCITALLNEMAILYQTEKAPESWIDGLYQHLQTAPGWQEYTAALLSDRKQLEAYLPNYKDRSSIARWLARRS